MIRHTATRTRPWILTIAASCGLVLGAGQTRAEGKLDFHFAPPQIEVQPICTVRPPDEQTTALWRDWDGKALPRMDTALIKRDLNRLLHLDGPAWYDTAVQIIDRLEEKEPSFAGQNALLSRIAAMEKAGRYTELRKSQLVPELAAMGETLSGRALTALSRYYRDGIGIDRDVARADALLVQAGFSGNADALLALSRMAVEGKAPAAWDVPLELAVSMAFGSLVGELNPTICDRTARIAREYHNGVLVQQDRQLAHDWFRFTADLGDAYAAWKVVEYHLEAEEFQKDNAVLLTYLTKAADAGLPYAQIELGRLYEVGSLVPQDLDRALALYEKAASIGERPGLTRVALFIERYADLYPHLAERRIEMLQALTKLPDPPGWAFTRMAQIVLDEKGRWDGAAEARALLERAAALGDLDGITNLGQLILADARTEAEFNTGVNHLARGVAVFGGVTPLKTLFGAYNCQAPDAPRMAEAGYWHYLEDATATANLHLSAQEVLELTPQDDPLQIATLQSHALYGRPTALASWLKLLETGTFADAEQRAFWEDYSDRYAHVIAALAKLEFELAQSREQRLAAFGLLREEYKRSGPSAALALAQALLDSRLLDDPELAAQGRAEAQTLLADIAALGNGKAIELLAGFEDTPEGRRAVFDTYREVIDRNGDFWAMLFAAPMVEGAARDKVLRRARGLMSCDYKNAMLMANIHRKVGERDAYAHWVEVAATLTEDNAWAMTDLARAKLDLYQGAAATEVQPLLRTAFAMGDAAAGRELFQLHIDEGYPTYDPTAAVRMIEAAMETEQSDLLVGYLGRYRKSDPATRQAIEAQLDLPQVLLTSAGYGDVYSMRSYGQYLTANAKTPADLTQATDWLRQAAEWGDTTAMAEYGEALAFGIGVPPNPSLALVWLERAAAGGSTKSAEITRLVRLSQGG
ncbi:tetratricopeptide repeat protein [Tropicibacter naphthalenivorans]|uniref:Sel1 repeat n=1 Tax=Tropicibacter naphthalenivorans TaxID=441103 RepID=A0A0P1GF27_9RHOB|nr:SEL1-like repeat protein [Tropicibacter naphthalenivorans]CUH80080.1 Sel1 repeat [Tropicibacter naphthalenivorans]SMC84439.1 TPR repeat [Tropicibacter naphthalenivorans]